ncbi:hypothetical protein KUCAC02_035019, partial [Chaenocephalus aceratus]
IEPFKGLDSSYRDNAVMEGIVPQVNQLFFTSRCLCGVNNTWIRRVKHEGYAAQTTCVGCFVSSEELTLLKVVLKDGRAFRQTGKAPPSYESTALISRHQTLQQLLGYRRGNQSLSPARLHLVLIHDALSKSRGAGLVSELSSCRHTLRLNSHDAPGYETL